MKPLSEYIAESSRTYKYRVRIAGEVEKSKLDAFNNSLSAYQVVNVGKPKRTPIAQKPFGFPGLSNVEVTIFDIELAYPAAIDELIELARRAGCDPAYLRITDPLFGDSMDFEMTNQAESGSSSEAEQAAMSKSYSESFREYWSSGESPEFEIAGGKPPSAAFSTDSKVSDTRSPLTRNR